MNMFRLNVLPSQKALLTALALTASLFSTHCLASVDMNSAKPQIIEGHIGKFLEPGLFWLLGNDGVKVLVYSNGEATKNFHSGQTVRVTGLAPMDWARLADQELNAGKIESN